MFASLIPYFPFSHTIKAHWQNIKCRHLFSWTNIALGIPNVSTCFPLRNIAMGIPNIHTYFPWTNIALEIPDVSTYFLRANIALRIPNVSTYFSWTKVHKGLFWFVTKGLHWLFIFLWYYLTNPYLCLSLYFPIALFYTPLRHSVSLSSSPNYHYQHHHHQHYMYNHPHYFTLMIIKINTIFVITVNILNIFITPMTTHWRRLP